MKNLILFVLLFSITTLFAQQKKATPNSASWDQFEKLNEDGLYKDALNLLTTILDQAIKKNNSADFQKALNKYVDLVPNALLENDEKLALLNQLEHKIDQTKVPLNNIGHLFLANLYNQFYYQWELDEEFKLEINKEIITNHYQGVHYHYKKALLHFEDLINYDAIGIHTLYESDSFDIISQPTLLNYYLPKIKARFNNLNYKDTTLFYQTENLAKYSTDTILSLFQSLESFHLKNNQYYAYVETVFNRIEFITSNTNYNRTKYIPNLNWLIENLKNIPAVLKVIVKQAGQLNELGYLYDWKENPIVKNKNEQAIKLVEAGCQKYPTSLYYHQAQQFIYDIKNPLFEAQLNGKTFLNESNLLSITYKNIDSVHLSVFHIDKISYDTSKNFLKAYQLRKIHQKILKLDKNGLYNEHTKDFILPAWKETGKFLVMISENETVTNRIISEDSINSYMKFSYVFVDIHDFTVLYKAENGNGILHILDLKTGNPIKNTRIEIWDEALKDVKKYVSNKQGECIFPIDSSRIHWKVFYKNDSLEKKLIKKLNVNDEKIYFSILTDRAIYRPGQKVYFKIFAFKNTYPLITSSISTDINIKITDSEGKEIYVSTDNIKTNEFGTYSSSFMLPKNNLQLGDYDFQVSHSKSENESSTQFKVEEYKRPTFYIENQIKENQISFGDTINIIGKAVSFSGYPISKAKVKISIACNSNILSGKKQLDTLLYSDINGLYSYRFITNKNSDLGGEYLRININVTNTIGETQTNNFSKEIGFLYNPWSNNITDTEIFTHNHDIFTFNLNEKPKEITPFHLTILRKKSTNRILNNTWEESEFKAFTRSEFKNQFPNDVYFDDEIIESEYDTISQFIKNIGDSINFQEVTKSLPGNYKLLMYYINFKGDTIKNEDYLTSIDIQKSKNQHNDEIWISQLIDNVELGSKLPILIGTNYTNQYMHFRIYRKDRLILSDFLRIDKRKIIYYTIQKEDIEGLSIEVSLVRDNEVYTASHDFRISQITRTIKLKLESIRDYLKPGNKEKWILSTESKSTLSKEVVATLTDASLDKIESSNWEVYFPYNGDYVYNIFHESNRSRGDEMEFLNTEVWSDGIYCYRNFKNELRCVGAIRNGIYISSKSSISSNYSFRSLSCPSFGGGSGRAGWSDDEEFNLEKLVAFPPPVIVGSEVDSPSKSETSNKTKSTPRSNFNETAFFYPNLYADKDGKFSFEFTLPDALTTWKFRALAHDKEMNMGQLEEFFIAQKELMVQPNAPRFFRAGDTLEFSANVVNVSDKNLPVRVSLEWFNPFTNEVIPEVFGKMETQNIQLNAKQSQTVSWKLSIPKNGLDLIAYRIKASSESFTDSEEKAFPILSNRVFVTEALPITIEEKGNYTFTLDKLATSTSTTKQHENLVFDYASNPIWSVVKTLPAASKVNYPSSDALFHAYYTNVLGSKVLANNPAIKQMIAHWNVGASELTNPTIANSVDLTETPWVNAAKSESEQRKEIAFFLEENNLANQQKTYLEQLFQQRNMDGAWPWFAGGQASAYITNDIVFGFAQLNERPAELNASLNYLNNYYTYEFKKHTATENNQRNWLSEQELQWLYIQAVYQLPANEFTTLLAKTLAKNWTSLSLKQQAIAGMYLVKTGDKIFATKIAASIQNRATKRKNTGTYWNEKYYSNAESIETQAYILDFFTALGREKPLLNSIQLSLLNKKRGQLWENSSTTARVVHALISVPATDFSTKSSAIIRIGNETITKATNEVGELTQTWTKKEITPALGNVVIDQNAETPSFGSLTYSYTENIEHVTNSTTGLVLTKEIYLIQGDQEILVTPTTKLKVGDQLRIYLKVSSDRRIDFVHVKDLKAAGMENVNQLSNYGYGKNVSYYTTPYDNRTSFFIEHLPKGKSSVSYDVRLTHKGTQSIGYALVECLYALEFRGNTSGMKLIIE